MLNRNYLCVIAIFIFTSSFSQEVKKQKIDVEKSKVITSQTNTATGITKTTGGGFRYQWRYAGEEEWKKVDGRFKTIGPVLKQYPNSAKLFKQSLLYKKVGKPVSIVMMAGGMVMGGIGYLTQVDKSKTEFIDPETNQVVNTQDHNKGARALMFGGIATFGIGLAGYYTSFYLSVKKFDQSIIRYNRMVDKETESSSLDQYQLQIGLQSNPNANLPLLSLRMKL